MQNVSVEDLQTTGASIPVGESTPADKVGTFNVTGAYIHLCSVMKSYFYSPYNLAKMYQQNFIAQSIISFFQRKIRIIVRIRPPASYWENRFQTFLKKLVFEKDV